VKSDQTRSHVLFALRRVLRAIARLLIRTGIRCEEFSHLVAEEYIETAVRDFAHPTTPSRERVAMFTGLSKHQIDRYVDSRDRASRGPGTLMSVIVEVLQKWHTTPEYAGPYGIPRELEFATPSERCFRSLVSLVDQQVDPQEVLSELLRAGAVVSSGETHFRALSRSLMLAETMSPQLVEYYGRAMSRLASTLEHNIDPRNSVRRLARRVTADRGLPAQLIPEFETYARGKADEFLLDLDNWIATQASEEAHSPDPVDVGVYVFSHTERLADSGPLDRLVGP
jgi:hypothetical protein